MAGILSSAQVIARIRAIRQAKGMSAQQLADASGCLSRSAIANLESGRRDTLTLDEAAALCDALGVDLRVVISDEPMPVVTTVYVI